jgi:enoyl-CoA hydratase
MCAAVAGCPTARLGARSMAGTIDLTMLNNGTVAGIRVNNPASHNAISSSMWMQLKQAAERIAGDPDVRAVLVRGNRNVFSAGADIADFEEARSDPERASRYDDLVEQACRAIEGLPKPTVALIEGPCFGAGASLAAACDLRVATPASKFAVPAAKLGLGYDSRGIRRFLRAFGAPATAQLLLTADAIAALRAHALGAVHVLVEADEAENAAMALITRLCANAPLTMEAAKLALYALSSCDSERLDAADAIAARADASADYREGRRAFLEKRQPVFRGR